jgi:hypothetical protein
MNAGIVKSAEPALLRNGTEKKTVCRQWPDTNYRTAAMLTCTEMEE